MGPARQTGQLPCPAFHVLDQIWPCPAVHGPYQIWRGGSTFQVLSLSLYALATAACLQFELILAACPFC